VPTVSWLFLAVALVGAWFTFNAHVPQRRTGPFIVPSFLAGWLTTELARHHLVWQLIATLVFIWAGALGAWPGWIGLGVTLASWFGLARLVPIARRAEPVVESALAEGLGARYRDEIQRDFVKRMGRPHSRGRVVMPFLLRDRDVRVIRDLPYVDDGDRRHLLDVYVPREGAKDAPVLFQVHGGGWVIGNKHEQALPLMNYLAARGWVCVAANYRLSPRATFPDHLVDLKRALGWIREHIAELGGDPGFVVGTGGSAGGHLVALLGLTANEAEYQPGFEAVDTRLRACVPFYGVYDFADHYKLRPQAGFERFIGRMVLKRRFDEDPEAFRRASPMHRIHADAPPFFIIHGTHDSLASVEEARHFAKLLRETSRAPVAYAEIPGAQHAFEIFHSLRTRHVIEAVGRFLGWVHAGYLRGAAVAPESARRA
jgi:acetyl esterase/lipase